MVKGNALFQLSSPDPPANIGVNRIEKNRDRFGRKGCLVLPEKKLKEIRNLVLELDNNLSEEDRLSEPEIPDACQNNKE